MVMASTIFLLIVLLGIESAFPSLLPDSPRLKAENGHLILESAQNKNVLLKTKGSGSVMINEVDVTAAYKLIKTVQPQLETIRDTNLQFLITNLTRVAAAVFNENDLAGKLDAFEHALRTAKDNVRSLKTKNSEFDTKLSIINTNLTDLRRFTLTDEDRTMIRNLTIRIQNQNSGSSAAANSDLTAVKQRVRNLETTVSVLPILIERVNSLHSNNNSGSASGSAVVSIQVESDISTLKTKVRLLETKVNELKTVIDTNACDASPCRFGGTCIDTTQGYVCICATGYEGPQCLADVDECSKFSGTSLGCQNGGTCRNEHGSYFCICPSIWHGIHCTLKKNSCAAASSFELCGHGKCLDNGNDNSYTCLCDVGWTTRPGNPGCVHDIDECMEYGPPKCSIFPKVNCTNTPGSFRCDSCPSGYIGNGFHCTDIDECAINNGGCSTSPKVMCHNRPGTSGCGSCPEGYSGTGFSCNLSPICNTNPCHSLATCHATPQIGVNTFYCTCRSGFAGDGLRRYGASGCQASSGGVCTSNPCVHGTCSLVQNQNICTCYPGYTGTTCNQIQDMCISSPCLNGGLCSSTMVNSFQCTCPQAFTGHRCQTHQNVCGGQLAGDGGVVEYPGSHIQTFNQNISCAWIIRVDSNMTISVNFSSFNLVTASCRNEWMQIHDGPGADYPRLGKYCGSTKPGVNGVLNSTHNGLYIWLRTYQSISHDGFRFTWKPTEPLCGAVINPAKHGYFKSPGNPHPYPINRDCFWTLTADPGKRIEFSFTGMRLGQFPNCSADYLEMRNGLWEYGSMFGHFCSSVTVPAPVKSNGAEVVVHFHSDSTDTADTGFLITYKAVPSIPGCGGELTADSGVFVLPTSSNLYTKGMICEWEITVTEGEFIELSFTDFAIERHDYCNYDYVEVLDGNTRDSESFGRFCGDTAPAVFKSTSNVLFVIFKSDHSSQHAGFTANYKIGCGGEFTEDEGVLRSPYFPGIYPDNRVCTYVIKQPIGKAILLNFTSFDIEAATYYDDCRYDYLEIRDGLSSNSPLFGRYCGPNHSASGTMTSTLNGLWFQFVTDTSHGGIGFSVSYRTIDIACGGIHHELTGRITYPVPIEEYPLNSDCLWVIDMPPGHAVELTWHSFSLESNCYYDYVEVFDNATTPNIGGLIGRYCGTDIPPTVTTMGHIMTIHFHSDNVINGEGFSASYHSIDKARACGGQYLTSVGYITSPDYPENYPANRNCVWIITVPFNSQILLKFSHFHLQDVSYYSQECIDYLSIRNGGYQTSPELARLCGNETVREIHSHSHQLYIEFSSSGYSSESGFKLFWEETATGCGGKLTSPTGEFQSPGYPISYGDHSECNWNIVINKGSTIVLNFMDLSIGTTTPCYHNFLEVRDGASIDSPMIGERICYAENGFLTLNSTKNKMNVNYETHFHERSNKGFMATYNFDCFTVLSGPSGVIESPGYPNDYPYNRNCTWTIVAPKGNSLNISFSHFEVEDKMFATSATCEYDYVELSVGHLNSDHRTVKGHFCENKIPEAFSSDSRMEVVEIKFVSDDSVAHNGFRLEWIVHGCGGNLHGEYGKFTSPNYPNAYPINTICEWHITLPPGSRILIIVQEFHIEASPGSHECRYYDSLKIYGGPDKTSAKLMTLCHGITRPKRTTTQGNRALVIFDSDYSIRGKGFKISYRMLSGGCGGYFSAIAVKGEITTPNYPKNFDKGSDCDWYIRTDYDHTVILKFVAFDIPSHNCSNNHVAIHDGPSIYSTLLATICGSSVPSPAVYQSSGGQLTLRLKLDGYTSSRGFKAEYRQGCGATLNASRSSRRYRRRLTPPNFPHLFTKQTNCTWHLKANEGQKVFITFTDLNIIENEYIARRYNESCRHDFVAIYDGHTLSSPLLDKFCGTHVPLPLFSQSEYLTVQFRTNFGTGTGFRILYGTVPTSCGGDYWALSGHLASPSYPSQYPANMECIYTVYVGKGIKVQLTFDVFSLEDNAHCNHDYLEIHERNPAGKLLMHNCSTNYPEMIEATESFWIKFRSDGLGTADGFFATFTAVKFNTLTDESGEISSPMHPQMYNGKDEYIWIIRAPSRKTIVITVLDINIEVDPVDNHCYSSLVIHRSSGAYSQVLKTLCGYNRDQGRIYIRNGRVRIRFISKHLHMGSSFKIRYETIDNYPDTDIVPDTTGPFPNCSYNVYTNDSHSVTIRSPNYPSNYPDNLHCQWIIQTDFHSSISVSIKFVLEEQYTCKYDQLNIYDGIDGTQQWNKTVTLCNKAQMTNQRYIATSTGQYLKITFISDEDVNKKGFEAEIKTVCGGVLTKSDGIIKSPHYPFVYGMVRCQWKVKMKRGRTIKFTFDRFNVMNTTQTCIHNALMIYNGETNRSPYLGDGVFCGLRWLPKLETSSNVALLIFIGASGLNSTGDKGFHITYSEVSAACGGRHILTEDMDYIDVESPKYPKPSDPYTECSWIISGPVGTTLSAHFEAINIPETRRGSSRCVKQNVQFYDGGTVLSRPLTKKLCGTSQNPVATTDNIILIKYTKTSDDDHHDSHTGNGFKLKVHHSKCGGLYRGVTNQILTSPKYPDPYDDFINCTWHIESLPGYALQFEFLDLNVYNPSENCTSTTAARLFITDPITNITRPYCSEGIDQPTFYAAASRATITFSNNGTADFSLRRFKLRIKATVEPCGGHVTGTHGVITSPGYPHGLNSRYLVCYWRITGPTGTRIKITFNDFELSDHYVYGLHKFCHHNALHLFNNHAPYWQDMPHLGDYCGSRKPDPISSSMNKMALGLVIFKGTYYRGFNLTWTTQEDHLCGGILESTSGTIASPNYNHNIICQWTLNNPNHSNSTIRLDFNSLNIDTNYCADKINIRGILPDGGDTQHIKLCKGENHLPTYVLPYPTVIIEFISHFGVNQTVFNMSYSISNCGGYHEGPENNVSSPGFPISYPGNANCTWLFNYPYGNKIKVNFTVFNLHDSIDNDYVKLYNGPTPNSPLIGQYTGNNNPNLIASSMSYRLLMSFQSDLTNTGVGFSANLWSHSSGCGSLLHRLSGHISNPGFYGRTSKYSPNIECIWEVVVTPGYMAVIAFISQFDIIISDNCEKDYVQISLWQIINGDGGWVSQDRLCGKQLPDTIYSNTNKFRVKFRSDNATEGKGFMVEYSGKCGGVHSGKGIIFSPKYPLPYPNDVNCIYTIDADPDSYTTLNFSSLSIEDERRYDDDDGETPPCIDVLTISHRHYSSRLCGTDVPPSILLRGGPVTLTFSTNANTYGNFNGFMLHYEVQECGGRVTSPGELAAPILSRSSYRDVANCVWDIEAPEGKIVKYKFQQLRISDYTSNCSMYYVTVYEGFSENDLISTFCGDHTENLPNIVSHTRQSRLILKARSYRSLFKVTVTFQQKCGFAVNILNASDHHDIRSLDSDSDGSYEPFLLCRWLIRGNADRVAALTFTRFDLEEAANDTNSCTSDYVRIYDGPSTSSPEIAVFCGSTMPSATIHGSTNFMLVVFVSNSETESGGFTATATNALRTCGAPHLVATSTEQSLKSPNYPDNYIPSKTCVWTIVSATQGDRINLIIGESDFRLESSSKCVADSLYIAEFDKDSNILINTGAARGHYIGRSQDFNGREGQFAYGGQIDHIYCGRSISHHLISSNSALRLTFTTNDEIEDSGFRIQYTVATCNTTYTADTAMLIRRWGTRKSCYSRITVDEGKYITLYLQHAIVRNATGAPNSFKVYDGRDSTAVMIADFLGYVRPIPIYSSGSSLYFVTIGRRTAYRMNYAVSDKRYGCGGKFFGSFQLFTSPNYPDPPADNLNCTYTLAVNPTYHASIRIRSLDFPGADGCNETYLDVFDVLDNYEFNHYTRICAGDNVKRHISSTSRLALRFVTGQNANITGAGWRIISHHGLPSENEDFEDSAEDNEENDENDGN